MASPSPRISDLFSRAVWKRLVIPALALLALLVVPSHAPATITNGESANDLLGQFAAPQGTDTTVNYTGGCINDGPTPYSLANNTGIGNVEAPGKVVIDAVNHWLFVSDEGNTRILVFPLNSSTNLLASKTPSYVLGQSNFTSCTGNGTMFEPALGLAIDPVNKLLYVSDGNANAVGVFSTASMSNGESPLYTLGSTSNSFGSYNYTGTPGSQFFHNPTGLALDVTNQLLYVADSNNNRVMVFPAYGNAGWTGTGESASYVLGQTGFTTVSSGLTQSTLNNPTGLSYDSTNQLLYVVDNSNNRVMVFPAYGNASWTGTGENASYVLGQSSFTTNTSQNGCSTPCASGLSQPFDAVADPGDSLVYVSDANNNRVLAFSTTSLSNGENASFVLGEDSFFTNHNSNGSLPVNGGDYSSQSAMDKPSGLAFDSTNKLLYVNDLLDSRVMIFNTSSMATAQFSAVTQSGADACGISTLGALYCWGRNVYGEAGTGSTSSYGYFDAPVEVGTATNWTAVSQGDPNYDYAACGIAGGALYCWGHNAYGELGLGNTTDYGSPQQVGSATNWTKVSTSGYDTCGIAGGALYCWGQNAYGEVGNGGTSGFKTNTVFVTSSTTTGNVGGVTGADSICSGSSGGATTTGSLAPSGTYLAWLTTTTALAPSGISTFTSDTLPYVDVNGNVIASNWTQLVSGSALSFGIQYSELGGTALTGSVWTDVSTSGGASTSSTTSTSKNCVGWTNGTTSGDKGDVGTIGSTSSTWTAASTTVSCTTSEHLYCFEQNTGSNEVTTPTQIGSATNWTAISQGGPDTCGIAGGKLYCWGRNEYGELGLGNTTEYTAPQQVGSATNWTAISQGAYDTCGIAGGKLYCWGLNQNGELGLGNSTQYTSPQQVGTDTTWTTISIQSDQAGGDNDACGVDNGKLYCWGNNNHGQDGLGNTTAYNTPQQVGSATNWTTVSYGVYDTCGISGGQLYCWGDNNYGDDGLGNFTNNYYTPQAVNIFDVSVEDATDEIGQYASQSSTATVNWTQNAPNNGADAVGFWNPQGVTMDPVNHYLYVAENQNERILVYSLNADNSIPTTSGGHTATYVLGQTGLPSNLTWNNYGGYCTASGEFSQLTALAFDTANSRLFVSDSEDSRILVFNTATVSSGMAASYVIGQTSLTTCSAYAGTPSQSQFYRPYGLAYDAVNSRLFAADPTANRVLVFNVAPGTIANGENAAYVLGQTNFTNTTSGTTSQTMSSPYYVAYDPVNTRLFVADQGNNRVLVFNVPTGTNLTNKAASYVLGQANFTSGSSNAGAGSTTQSGLSNPQGLAYDATSSRLFVGDEYNGRIAVFNVGPSVIKNGEALSFELGQNISNPTQSGFNAAIDLFYDAGSQRLFVTDPANNRVMIFDVTPMTTNMQNGFLPGYD